MLLFSVTKSFSALCNPMDCSTPDFPVLHYRLEFAQTHVHWVGDAIQPSIHLIFCGPLLIPSVFPSIRVFSNESALLARWSKYWSFSISPSNECLGLLFFRIDWFDLLAVQRTLKSHLPVPISFGSFKPGRLQSMGSQSVRHDWATFTFICIHIDMVLSEKNNCRMTHRSWCYCINLPLPNKTTNISLSLYLQM